MSYTKERFKAQQDKIDFGGAFWQLTTEISGKDFMKHPGYKYDMKKTKDICKK